MSVDPAQLFVGAILGIAGTASIRWWQYRRDLRLSEADQFCDYLDKAVEKATEYWLVDKEDAGDWVEEGGQADVQRSTSPISLELLEAQILGYQIRLDGLYASIVENLIQADRNTLNASMKGLSDALTGGNFGAAARDKDPDRARLAQVYTSDIIVDVRRSLARSFTVKGSLELYWENLCRWHINKSKVGS